MPPIKNINQIKDKWLRRASSASGEYSEGVKNTSKDWATETSAAEQNYEAGVTAAIGRKAFGKGVAKAGTEKWRKGALDKGPQRYAQGVQVSGDAYLRGFQPYAEVIANLTLPKRGPKGDPANIQRVAVVAEALHNKKIESEG